MHIMVSNMFDCSGLLVCGNCQCKSNKEINAFSKILCLSQTKAQKCPEKRDTRKGLWASNADSNPQPGQHYIAHTPEDRGGKTMGGGG